ncbi:MAG: UDP-N-acetylglucosamine 2-epimerase (non-hydrolyzing) [Verrucomicrobiota bacterium]|nr:UDP-N-acetylglucosamine 2-epimerase (non-hydrolyzing) [Verrucomicrobiota bacterium]
MSLKILTVVGARPQFVKAAVISRAIRRESGIHEILVHTGQHFDANMSDVFFEEMEIPKPDYLLGIHGLSHGAMTGRMLEEIEKVLQKEKPDYLLVYGDTNSTLAAALAAKKLHIPIVHVEAGVRNFDETMPEEINRYLVDRLAALNFCCTDLGVENLTREGFFTGKINSEVFNCGDVMCDAAFFYAEKASRQSRILETLQLIGKDFIICTVHRANNTDEPERLRALVEFLNEVNKELPIVLPLHPRTRSRIQSQGLTTRFTIIDPVGYLDMIMLEKQARYVFTDSGGVVREAYFFHKPSLFFLEQPVWPELVDGGYCINVAPKAGELQAGYQKLIQLKPDFHTAIYGDGSAGDKILSRILSHHARNASRN